MEVSCAALNGLYPLGCGPQVADDVHQAFHSAVQVSVDFLLKNAPLGLPEVVVQAAIRVGLGEGPIQRVCCGEEKVVRRVHRGDCRSAFGNSSIDLQILAASGAWEGGERNVTSRPAISKPAWSTVSCSWSPASFGFPEDHQT